MKTVRRVVRRLGSAATHVADISPGQFEEGYCVGYYCGVTSPAATVCGAVLRSPVPLVCMRPGTAVNCRPCVQATGMSAAPADNQDTGEET